MKTVAEFLPDSSRWMSFVRGPIVLAASTDATDLVGLKGGGSRMGHIANGPLYAMEDAPMIVAANTKFNELVVPIKNKPFTYKAPGIMYPLKYKDLELVPFYTIHDTRYMLYWRYATPQQLQGIEESLRKSEEMKMALDAATIDQVAPGEQQPESDHNFQGQLSEAGIYKDRHWRSAKDWFSYDLKDADNKAKKIRITYFGLDKNRSFSIYLNNVLVQNVRLDGSNGDQFFDVDYAIPTEVLNAKATVLTLKFQAQPNAVAGGIYFVRLMK